MSSVVISGDTSGAITLAAPAVAGTNTITLPALTGTAVIAGQNSAITASTAQASTSGTSIDFTSIPSWVKRVTVMFSGVGTSGTSAKQIQLGSGSPQTTGYVTNAIVFGGASLTNTQYTTAFILGSTIAADRLSATITFSLLSSNSWEGNGAYASVNGSSGLTFGGVTLSGTLDRVRITTANGTDTFAAGSINILYE
jgi:hypothetical protein